MSKPAPKSEDTPKGGGDKGEDKKGDGEGTHVEKEAKQEKKEEATPKYKLKYGDYTVQVHIIECRELKGRGFGEMSDPVVVVECMGQKKHTKRINNNLNPVFDEVLYFDFRNVYPNELERSKAVVKILDANTLRRDVLIGQYDFDLATVYYNKHHEIYRAWAALTDVTDANEGIQGYVKCSVTVLGPDDEQYTHSAADADDDENGMLAVLMPPNVEQIGRILKVRCYEADGLPQMDDGISLGAFGAGLCDPYVRVEFAGLDVKTPKQNGQKVTWNNELQIPVMEPIMASRIRLSLYDWDAAGDDDRISTMMLDYNDIKASDASSWDFSEVQLHVIQNIDIHGVKDLDALRERQAADKKRRESQSILPIPSDEKKKDLPNYALPRWYILYGAPSGKQSGEASKMNRGYIPGSFYRGRVLLAFKTEDATDPKKDCTTCLALPLDQRPPEERYIIQCDLYEGSEIPDRGDMYVEVCIGPHVMKSSVVPTKEARCQWYHIFKDLPVDYPKDLTQCPDVFVYLVHKGKRLSFVRYRMADLIAKGWKVAPTWTIMQEDVALDGLDNDEFPGTLLFSLRAGPLKTLPAQVFPESRPLVYDLVVPEDTKVLEEVKAAETAPLLHRTSSYSRLPKLGNLTLTVVEAVNLPAMDSNGFSDPFCKLKMDTTSHKTGIIKKTLNPKWGETFKFNNANIDHTIAISVWDHDTLSDDKIGEFSVDLKSQCIAAKVAMGQPFTHQAWFLVNDKYPNASISLKFQWEYLPGEKQVLTEAKTDKNILNKSKTFFSKITNTSKPKPINPELGICATGQFQLRVHLYQARNLPASDSTGLSDPYVVIRVCGKKMRFGIKKETVNPHWYQSMSVNVDLPVPLNMSPEIQVFCMDWDATSKDDPMGRFALSCADAMSMCPGPKPVPRWFEMYDWSGKKIEGATILMAFQLLSSNQVNEPDYKTMPVIAPKTLPMTLEVTTLGLRGLQSTLGVHKTFIEFELPGGKKFKTLPSKTPSAESPNFLQVLKIPVDVPVERIFAPCLDIDVKDMMLGGLIKRTIGTASMDLAQFMEADPNDPTKWAVAEKKGLSGPASDAEIEAELKTEELMRKAEEELKKAKEAEEARKAAELAADKRVEDRRAFEAAVADEKRSAESKAAAVADGRIQPIDENKTSPSEQGMGLGLKDGPQPQRSGQSGVQGGSSQPGFQPVEEKHDGDSGAGTGKDVVIEINESKRGGDAKKNLSDEGGLGSLDASLDDEDDVNQPLLGKDMKKSDKEKKDAKPKTAKERRDEKNARWDADDKDQNPTENPADELPGYMQGRLVVDDELEDSMPLKPFHTIDLFTGQKNATKFFGDQYRKVGNFKGLVRLTDYATEQKQTVTNKELLNPKDLYVRLYILRGLGLTPKDSDGLSDPYLIIKLGKKTINLRDKHINNTLDPDFYEAVEIPCTIPGDAQLEITVMDWDGIGDDFIGKTVIDIEDRWFNKQWRKLPKKPVERRTLHSPSSNHAQGKLELWMEILTPLQSKKEPIIYIKPPPPSNWEIRVIVWGVRDVPNFDEWTDQNDLYVTGRCTYPGLKMQETDTHLRAKNGKGNFNWRMKFPIQLPVKTWPRLQFQIWDKDFFSANDSICEAQISLKALCKRALKKRDRVKVYMKRSDRFWLEKLSHPNKPGKNMGRMEISLELMPSEVAAQLPAGFGRSDPNTNPFLPPPEGRVNWSLFHPFAMCKEILGANLYRKVCLGCWCTLFIAACVFMAPMIVSNVFSNLITKF